MKPFGPRGRVDQLAPGEDHPADMACQHRRFSVRWDAASSAQVGVEVCDDCGATREVAGDHTGPWSGGTPVLARDVPAARPPYRLVGGWIYAILAPELDRVKIGKSERSATHRLNEIVPQSPAHLELHSETWHEDCEGAERQLHARFAHARERGEWFKASDPRVAAWLEGRLVDGDFRHRLHDEMAALAENSAEPPA